MDIDWGRVKSKVKGDFWDNLNTQVRPQVVDSFRGDIWQLIDDAVWIQVRGRVLDIIAPEVRWVS